MIKVKNLRKTYFKGKEKEIKVINNTSLELPDQGLISILGPSGCGKTTLLNTIGGLDKAYGEIDYGDFTAKKYNMHKIDLFRNQHIGYIFQNYLLLEDLTVYENLVIALKIIGITDKEEIDKRTAYTLKAVGLYKYRKKIAGQLSGGQQQRVSIARALLKNAKLIIADEPTGNLDSENSIEIMNILKKISEKTLVLLVTHSKQLSDFYADRIIEIKDGIVTNDYQNSSSGVLENKNDRQIHLLDYEKNEISTEDISFEVYSDTKSTQKKITLILKNDTIYIEANTRIQLISDSNIELHNDHYKALEVKSINNFEYDTSWYNTNIKNDGFKLGLLALKDSVKDFFSSKKKTKVFNVIFFLIGIILSFVIVLHMNYTSIDTSKMNQDPTMFTLKRSDYSFAMDSQINKDSLRDAISKEYIKEIYIFNEEEVNFTYSINTTRKIIMNYTLKRYDYTTQIDESLIYGHAPTKPTDIVIGKAFADEIINDFGNGFTYEKLFALESLNYTISGVSSLNNYAFYKSNENYISLNHQPKNYNIFLNTDFFYEIEEGGRDILNSNEVVASYESNFNVGDTILTESKSYEVVGKYNSYCPLFDMNNIFSFSPLIFTKDIDLLSYYVTDTILTNSILYSQDGYYLSNKDLNYTLLSGEEPTQNQCLANVASGLNIGDKIGDFEVSGLYKNDKPYFTMDLNLQLYAFCADERQCLIINHKDYLLSKCQSNLLSLNEEFQIDNNKQEEIEDFFKEKGYDLVSMYTYQTKKAEEINHNRFFIFPLLEAIFLVLILIYIYFSTRAKMISEIYVLGVKRSLGSSRLKICGKYLVDIFVKASFTTLLGYIIFIGGYCLIAQRINSIAKTTFLFVNWSYIILGIVLLYLFQLIVGLIPVIMLLHKTPSEINSKYDI